MDLNVVYFTRPLSGFLMVGMPIALGIYLTRRFKLGWRLFFLGAATFILSQVGHIPFNRGVTLLFQRGILPPLAPGWNTVFNAVFLGLSAGLWEEGMRYAVYRKWAKDARSWGKGLLFGAGHGGIEAILLGLLVLYAFVQMFALRGADLSRLVAPDQLALAQKQVADYWSFPWPGTLLGAVERLFSLTFHLSCSILVLQTFTRRQSRWVWLAVLWHALADGVFVAAAQIFTLQGPNIYLVEIPTGIFALASLAIIFSLRQPEPVEASIEEAIPVPQLTQTFILPSKEETIANLEDTRYQ